MSQSALKSTPLETVRLMEYHTWSLVADFVPAHPQCYTRLAQVNKTFRKIFMSDRLWKKLDFYDIKMHIADHYLVKSYDFTLEEKYVLSHSQFGVLKYIPSRYSCCHVCFRPASTAMCPHCKDWREQRCCNHVKLEERSYCRHCDLLKRLNDSTDKYAAYLAAANYPDLITATDMLKLGDRVRLLLIEEYGLLKFASIADRDDSDFVKSALVKSPLALQYASERLRDDVEVACLAIRGDPSAYKYVRKEVRDKPEIFQTYLQALRRSNT